MMELANKKNVKVISLAVGAIFVVSMFIVGVGQSGLGREQAGSPLDSAIGKVTYNDVMKDVPGIVEAQSTMRQEIENSQKEFEEKSKNMNEEEKQKLYSQYQEKLQLKEKDLIEPLKQKVDKAVLAVGKKKGLMVVVDKSAVAYGGLDVTADVTAELKK